MKRPLWAVVFALLLPSPGSAAKGGVKVLELTGGTLTAEGKYLVAGDKLPKRKTATLQRGARLVLQVPMGKVLFKGPAVFSMDAADGQDTVDLKTGGLLAALHKAEGKGFAVRTPGAAMAVRGTTFFTETRGSNATYLCVCEGAVDVGWEKASFHTAVLADTPHKAFLFKYSGVKVAQTKSGMSGHDDDDIASLRAP